MTDGKGETRIALFSATLGGGGAERVVATLANGFVRSGHQVDVVLIKRVGSYLAELDESVRVVDLSARRTIFALVPLALYIRKEQPAALLSTQAHLNVIAVIARGLVRTRTRLFVREATTPSVSRKNRPSFREWVVGRLIRPAYARADGIIAPSQGVAEDLTDSFGLERARISVIPNPLDIDSIRELAELECGKAHSSAVGAPVVLGVGRLSEQKDFATLIRAFATVVRTRPARLVILGEGENRESLLALAEALGVREHVDLPGFVANPYGHMKHAAVYVLSSRYEGLPNALLQALAVGTPCIATDCTSGPREALGGGRWGRLVPVGEADAMAEGILAALGGRVSVPPQETVERTYGIEAVAQRYLRVLLGTGDDGARV